jgi:Flp pilus assembly protein TadD
MRTLPLVLLLLGGGMLASCAEIESLSRAADGAASVDPEEQKARNLMLDLVGNMQKEGLPRAALAYLDDYELRYPGDPRAQLLRASSLIDIGDLSGAEAAYGRLLGGPYAAASHAGLGRVAAARGQWRPAMAEFDKAVRLNPINVGYLNNLGYSAMKAGDFERAEFALRQASELEPANASVRNNLLITLHMAGKTAEVERLIASIASPDDRRAVRQLLSKMGATPTAPPAAAAVAPPPMSTPALMPASMPAVTPTSASPLASPVTPLTQRPPPAAVRPGQK